MMGVEKAYSHVEVSRQHGSAGDAVVFGVRRNFPGHQLRWGHSAIPYGGIPVTEISLLPPLKQLRLLLIRLHMLLRTGSRWQRPQSQIVNLDLRNPFRISIPN